MDKKFRIPRIWSNRELEKFAPLFTGRVVNVSGWTDVDKEGRTYCDYFKNAAEYYITNYKEDEKGFQGLENEIFLDLEKPLPAELRGRFDVAYNHTTLEHIFDCRLAFHNLCAISSDVVIAVVPYIQQMHGSGYKDYWRFTPTTMRELYEWEGLTLRYCSANGADAASIYLFCIGYRDRIWDDRIPFRFDIKLDESKELYADDYTNVIGGRVILND